MKQNFMVLFCLAAALCGAQQAIPLDSILSAQIARELESSGKIQKISYKDKKYQLSLVPQTELNIAASKIWTAKKVPVFIAETLYLIKKQTATEPGADTEIISQILRSLSTLKGIEYYSNSGQRMSTLYHTIYAVKSPEDRTPIADPAEGSADGQVIYTEQEMATFGSGLYQYKFRQTADSVLYISENMDPITYSIFKLVKPGNFKFALCVTDLGDSVLVYSLVEADFFAIASLEERLTGAFSSRAEAVYNWFETMYLQATEKVVQHD